MRPEDEFFESCKEETIFVLPKAQEGAKQFNLIEDVEIMAFISNGGLENLKFKNPVPLEKWPHPPPPPMVYAATFTSGREKNGKEKRGYIAFYKSTVTGLWMLKSFKPNDKFEELKDYPFSDLPKLMRQVGLEREEKTGEEYE